jgi:hypothetical protein
MMAALTGLDVSLYNSIRSYTLRDVPRSSRSKEGKSAVGNVTGNTAVCLCAFRVAGQCRRMLWSEVRS